MPQWWRKRLGQRGCIPAVKKKSRHARFELGRSRPACTAPVEEIVAADKLEVERSSVVRQNDGCDAACVVIATRELSVTTLFSHLSLLYAEPL